MVKIRIIALAIIGIMLVGCKPIVKTEYKTTLVPTYVVPKPPVYERPTLYLSTMTEAQKDDLGELAKGYYISTVQLQQYTCILEKVLDKYKQLSEQNNPKLPTLALSDKDKLECQSK